MPNSNPLPWAQLKKELDASVPEKTEGQWEFAGQIETQDGRIILFDPWSYRPDYPGADQIYQLVLEGRPGAAKVFLERIEVDVDHWRNSAVKILFSEAPETHREKIGEVSVEVATLAVASESAYVRHWMVGGELSESSIWIQFMEKEERNTEGKRAADLVSSSGYRLEYKHDWLYGFAEPLSNEDIERLDTLLHEATIRGHVNTVVHHSFALIRNQLAKHYSAVLDAHSQAYLIAFESGWGDGTYDCYAIKSGNETVGYISQLIELEQIE